MRATSVSAANPPRKEHLRRLARFSPLALAVLALLVMAVDQSPLRDWFLTADQQGGIMFRKGRYADSATLFADPLWAGAAWFRVGEFEQAARAFSRIDTAAAHYNRANALLMQGEYESAIEAFDQALERQPDWPAAIGNREIARLRAQRLELKGGDMTDGEMAADDFDFDFKADKGQGQPETAAANSQTLNDEQVQALWLRRVQTRPADFLRARFAYQQANAGQSE
jgi:Ca-activated chloride channel family protein